MFFLEAFVIRFKNFYNFFPFFIERPDGKINALDYNKV